MAAAGRAVGEPASSFLRNAYAVGLAEGMEAEKTGWGQGNGEAISSGGGGGGRWCWRATCFLVSWTENARCGGPYRSMEEREKR
jgi:hypothetical protein